MTDHDADVDQKLTTIARGVRLTRSLDWATVIAVVALLVPLLWRMHVLAQDQTVINTETALRLSQHDEVYSNLADAMKSMSTVLAAMAETTARIDERQQALQALAEDIRNQQPRRRRNR